MSLIICPVGQRLLWPELHVSSFVRGYAAWVEDFVASEYEGSIESMFLVEGLLSFFVLCLGVGV